MLKNRTILPTLSLFLAAQVALVTPASLARAANNAPAAAPAPAPVQPVPYPQSQPVPYAQPSALVPTTPSAAPQATAQVGATVSGTGGTGGNDVVVLKSGGMVRGTLIEILPNDHATVTLATGQNAIIQWDHIHHIERGGAAAATPAPAATRPTHEPTARVHVESDHPVTIERRVSVRTWAFACEAPCDVELPLSDEYRIVGAGVRTSSNFHLAAQSGERVVLDVNTGSKAGFIGGVILVPVGGLTILIGLLVVAAGAVQNTVSYDYTTGSYNSVHDGSDLTRSGWITVAIGAAATLGGILMITGNRTSVDQEPAQARIGGDTWAHLPTWRDDQSAIGAPKPVSLPIFSGAF